jgi:hypothetical protein
MDAWHVEFKKMHKKYYIDYIAFDQFGIAKAVVEIKCRDNAKRQYNTLILSLAKWNMGARYYDTNGLSFLVVARWTDGVFVHQYSPKNGYHITMGGRTDRGDAQDIEPVIHIPISNFTRADKVDF